MAVGESPRGVAIGDFNGDGKADIVTANQMSNSISVLLAAAGNFPKVTASTILVGEAPRSLAIGDFNGDKKPDMAVGNSAAGTVSILLGDGTGHFAPAPGSPVAVGGRPLALAALDLDANGKLDLAIVNNTGNSVVILLGNGVGGFSPAPRSPFAVGKTPFFVASGDFNGDKAPDLVVANSGSNDVSILIGLVDGSFAAKADFAVGTGPRSLAIGDFNSDKKLDLVVSNSAANSVSFLPGDGTGDFGAKKDFAVGMSPRSVVAGDFDGDGKADLAVANDASNNVSILLSDGTGNFRALKGATPKAGSHPVGAALSDLNGDTKLDLIVVNSGSNDVSLLAGDGLGNFKPLR